MKLHKKIKQQGDMYYVRIPKTLLDTGILNTEQLYQLEITEVKKKNEV